MVAPQAFAADPLRALRLARLAVELRFAIDPDTAAAARAHAAEVAGVAQERVFAELRRIVTAPSAVEGMALLDDLGLTEAVLPEVDALRGVQQSDYHHRDVYGHTLEVLGATVDLEADPAAAVGEQLAPATRALLAEPLADGLTRGGALRFGALLHDAAKPQTRVELPGGRVGFPDHDRLGADVARAALGRLRASERLRAHVAGLARHHLRLGFLVHEAPLERRAAARLPAGLRRRGRRRHAAVGGRPAGHPRAQGRRRDRQAPRRWPAWSWPRRSPSARRGHARGSCAATSSQRSSAWRLDPWSAACWPSSTRRPSPARCARASRRSSTPGVSCSAIRPRRGAT